MTDEYRAILQKYWGYDDFRGIQRDIIESIGEGRDTLGLMPTGGGKSITFQVPALAAEGLCIIVTPLIALMKDQVAHLRSKGIKAMAIYSGLSRNEVITTLENAVFGGVKMLYVSPERLSSDLFQKKICHVQVSFIAVDEAHCISQWGYDFRPSYLQIAHLRHLLAQSAANGGRHIPVLALTATATPEVVDDIQERLEFREKNVFRMSYERKNLAYVVRYANDKMQQLMHILNTVDGSAIIYVRSRKGTREIADHLTQQGIDALAYNAGLDSTTRDFRQTQWQQGRTRVMVATNAFGMGIDKPDVRLVIHIDCPSSLEEYFQEAGRAGRDGKKAYAVLLYNKNDKFKLRKRIQDSFPDKQYLRDIYDQLAFYYEIGVGSGMGAAFEFDIDKFSHAFKRFPLQVNAALHLLTRAGYILYEEERDQQARIRFMLSRDQLYRLDFLSKAENDIITVLLRNYTGLFTDYSYIDLPFIAQQAQLANSHNVYMILKSLSDRRIVHFIPQRKTPYITYLQRREDGKDLVISQDVYEKRKEQYAKRVDHVIDYLDNDDVCRSRQLLRYFGEVRSDDCGMCDVCHSHKPDHLSEERQAPVIKKILDLLADGQPHGIEELNHLAIPTESLDAAIRHLVNEEYVYVKNGKINLM